METEPTELDPTKTYKTNLYAGKCHSCSGWVGIGKGLLFQVRGKWAVSHIGECPKAQPPTRKNSYAQDCHLCGVEVPAGEGAIEKNQNGKWTVSHLGECPKGYTFPDGRYALRQGDSVRFYHCWNQKVYSMASDMEIPLTSTKSTPIIEKIEENPLEAAKLYGIEFGICGVCGRGLTSEWRKAGIGPVCASKMG